MGLEEEKPDLAGSGEVEGRRRDQKVGEKPEEEGLL